MLSRSKRLNSTLALVVLLLFLGVEEGWGMRRLEVDFEYVDNAARKLSKRSHKSNATKAHRALQELDYDKYRRIRFKEESSLWREEGLPFWVQFYHLGYLFGDPVVLNEYTDTHSQEIRYTDSMFDFDGLDVGTNLSSSLGYAGFKLMHPVEDPLGGYGEIASFLGGSYFRALGRGMHYGISTRGLAIDAGLAKEEEFPRFVEFWLGKPLGNARSVELYALMDSPSVTGAFRFIVTPGEDNVIEVKSTLYFRNTVESLGIAPLTSMFWRGENIMPSKLDYRPEVHDSDGLLIANGNGERIWRPLCVSERTRLSYFNLQGFDGFGLFQRDRNFDHYQDLESEFERRPSVWIEPIGDWGMGHVKLVELSTDTEYMDNIVAFWEPKDMPEVGESLSFEYRLHWTKRPSFFRTVEVSPLSTRIGESFVDDEAVKFVIDFGRLDESSWDGAALRPELKTSVSDGGVLLGTQVVWNQRQQTWRAILDVLPDKEVVAIELRCELVFPDDSKSEIWTYQWTL